MTAGRVRRRGDRWWFYCRRCELELERQGRLRRWRTVEGLRP